MEQRPRAFNGQDGVIPRTLVPNGSGGFTAKQGEVIAEGQVKYSGVVSSAGPVWIFIDTAWRPVTGTSAAFNLAYRARMSATGSAGTDTLKLDYTNLRPWKPGSMWLELHVPTRNESISRPNSLSADITDGATSGTSSFAANQLVSTAISGAQGDWIHALQFESTSASTQTVQDFTHRVIAGGTITDLTLPNPGGAQRTVSMSTAVERSVTLTANAPAFETAAEQPSTTARTLQLEYLVETHLPAPAGAYETWRTNPPLIETQMLQSYKDLTAAPTSPATWSTSYADVFPATNRRFAQAIYVTASPTGRSLEVHTHRLVEASGTFTLAPVVSAPRNIRIQGTEQGGVTTVSGLAHLTWSPPTTGTASSYTVEIWYVDVSQYLLGRLVTTSTDLVVPFDLKAGKTHYAIITAVGQSGDSTGSASAQSGSFRGP